MHGLFPNFFFLIRPDSEPLWGTELPQRGTREEDVDGQMHLFKKKKKGSSITWRQVESKECCVSHPFNHLLNSLGLSNSSFVLLHIVLSHFQCWRSKKIRGKNAPHPSFFISENYLAFVCIWHCLKAHIQRWNSRKKKILNFSDFSHLFFVHILNLWRYMQVLFSCQFFSWTYLQKIISSINSKNMGSWS